MQKLAQSTLVLFVFDVATASPKEVLADLRNFQIEKANTIVVGNKTDLVSEADKAAYEAIENLIWTSANDQESMTALKAKLSEQVEMKALNQNQLLVSNARHYEAFLKSDESLETVANGLAQGISGDLLATDIRQALHHLGTITGEITTDDLLGSIFSRFCIGK